MLLQLPAAPLLPLLLYLQLIKCLYIQHAAILAGATLSRCSVLVVELYQLVLWQWLLNLLFCFFWTNFFFSPYCLLLLTFTTECMVRNPERSIFSSFYFPWFCSSHWGLLFFWQLRQLWVDPRITHGHESDLVNLRC